MRSALLAFDSAPVDLQRQRLTFEPAPSGGLIVGVGLALICFVAAAVILGTTSATPVPTRLLAFGYVVALVAMGVICGIGALQCRQVRYVLGSDALEIRWGISGHSIRYDQIESIQGGASLETSRPSSLWPGAGFGFAERRGRGTMVLRASTLQPSWVVVVGSEAGAFVTSPNDPPAFKEALIERARNSVRRPGAPPRPGATLIDRIAAVDAWFRAGCLATMLLAAIDLAIFASRGVDAPRHTFAAASVIVLNVLLGATGLSRIPAASRLLIGTTVCAQIIGMIW